MKNIFAQRKDYVEGRKRNTFDLTYTNNLTMEMGKLYPVFCKEVLPGDSFKISPTFGLRYMPLQFPVQTRMNATLHFFYVRNRNLWKDWPDFIGRTKDGLVPPYLSVRNLKKFAKTRAIGDYLGLPTTFSGKVGRAVREKASDILYSKDDVFRNFAFVKSSQLANCLGTAYSRRQLELTTRTYLNAPDPTESWAVGCCPTKKVELVRLGDIPFTKPIIGNGDNAWEVPVSGRFVKVSYKGLNMTSFSQAALGQINPNYQMLLVFSKCYVSGVEDICPVGSYRYTGDDPSTHSNLVFAANGRHVNDPYAVYVDTYNECFYVNLFPEVGADQNVPADYNHYCVSVGNETTIGTSVARQKFTEMWETILTAVNANRTANGLDPYSDYNDIEIAFGGVGYAYTGTESDKLHFSYPTVSVDSDGFKGFTSFYASVDATDTTDIADSINPYLEGDLKISALPFRAYESIYNAYYRNAQNDPFKINGVAEYNKFIPSNDGGEDDNEYGDIDADGNHIGFYYRNWEPDFLTSATQTPQQGDITPLVGVSANGDFTFQNQDGTQYVVHPIVSSDGHTLTGIDSYEGTPDNNAGIRRLMDMITYGISINDFRNVNALQRWLETNLRRGYKYRDQIKSHFNVDVEYKELDMPEFLGGMSERVFVNQINQQADLSGIAQSGKPLGAYAGQASILADSKHSVSHYCDEHGFIIGIMCVHPVPNYSQVLPKMFLKDNVLDYFFPEFGHIGNQPITLREVCPLQAYAKSLIDSNVSLDNVFGYQRAWYDYIASIDEVHGDMRLSLRDFLVNRVFDDVPELGHDFLFVDPKQINDIFSMTEDGAEDHIVGQIIFDISAQREIPKFSIPRLE